MCPRDESSYVDEFDRYGSPPVNAGAVVRFASVGDVVSSAGAFDLQVADCALGVNCCKSIGNLIDA